MTTLAESNKTEEGSSSKKPPPLSSSLSSSSLSSSSSSSSSSPSSTSTSLISALLNDREHVTTWRSSAIFGMPISILMMTFLVTILVVVMVVMQPFSLQRVETTTATTTTTATPTTPALLDSVPLQGEIRHYGQSDWTLLQATIEQRRRQQVTLDLSANEIALDKEDIVEEEKLVGESLMDMTLAWRHHRRLETAASTRSDIKKQDGGRQLRGNRKPKLPADEMEDWSDHLHDDPDNSPTTAACLTYKDDPNFLREWIAYHYHVTNLRHLILRMDAQHSENSPTVMLEPWRGRMHIDVWHNDTFMSTDDLQKLRENKDWYSTPGAGAGIKAIEQDVPESVKIEQIFVNRCLKKLKQRNVGWTMIFDIDEFLRINYKSVNEWGQNHRKSPVILSKPPPIGERGSVMTFLQELRNKEDPSTILPELTDSACIQFPRSRFGLVESTKADRAKYTPRGIKSSDFSTMRYRFHAAPDSYVDGNKGSRAMVDLSRIEEQDLEDLGNKHMPVTNICTYERMMFTKQQDHVFVLNHYVSGDPEEAYFARMMQGNKRRGKNKNHEEVDDFESDEIRPWMHGFIRLHGWDAVNALLYPESDK